MRIAYLALVEIDVSNACMIHTREMSEQLAALGHEVTLILPLPLRMQAWRGVQHVWVRWWGFGPARQWAFFVESAWRLWWLHRQQRFDVLYVREIIRHSFLPWLAGWLRVPLVVEVNGWALDDLELLGASPRALRGAERCQRNLFSAAHGILASTVGNAEKVTTHYGILKEKVYVQELGSNTGHLSPGDKAQARAELGLPLEKQIILFAGSFHPHHDLGTLLDAFAQLVSQDSKRLLLLVGDGTQRQAIRLLSESLKIAGQVRMVGVRPYEEMPMYFRAADIGVLPLTAGNIRQRNGAIAAKLWDYMACGLPVVVTDFSDTPSARLLSDKAHVVPPEDAKAMADALLDLLKDVDKRDKLAVRGREYVLQHRTWKQAAIDTANFIAKRLEERT